MDVLPDKQNIDQLFSTRTYQIDFYQRHYRWTADNVNRLLDDVFGKFNVEYERHKDDGSSLDEAIGNYSWYYLNTYVTNIVGGKHYVVDGQQRLTTLTLILIKLKHLAQKHCAKHENWIEQKIVTHSGDFLMNHVKHKDTMQELLELDGKDVAPKDYTDCEPTVENMVKNFAIISSRLEKEILGKQFSEPIQIRRFECFLYYFMRRLVIIDLSVGQIDAPMIFEVINDRGLKLKPHEILKGNLLGQVSKEELDRLELDKLWEKQVLEVNAIREDEIDCFFTYYLKAKFADTATNGKKYDNDYHRAMYSENILGLNHNPEGIKDFLKNEFKYYTDLYLQIYEYSTTDESSLQKKFLPVCFNRLNEMDTQYPLIISSCIINDPNESEKIETVAYQLDRLYCLLQLQNCYDSNAFSAEFYKISSAIREKNIPVIENAFDDSLKKLINQNKEERNVKIPLTKSLFAAAGLDNLSKRFVRYFFARIEKFIADNMGDDGTKKNIRTLIGDGTNFHIEHILADNSKNRKLFIDDDKFIEQRNRLGDLLLIEAVINLKIGKDPYKDKLKDYAGSGFYWVKTLCENFYRSNHGFDRMEGKYHFGIKPMKDFTDVELDKRHETLFKMVKIIWK